MRFLVTSVLLFFFVLDFPPADASKVGQDPGNPGVDQKDVDRAVEKGAKYLLNKVEKGLAEVPHPQAGSYGTEELVLYTLLHAGVDQTDPRFKKLLKRVLNRRPERTYTAALRAMALHALDPKKYQQYILQSAQFLIDNQCLNGQWGYGKKVPLPVVDPPDDDVATGDAKKKKKKKKRRTRTRAKIPVRRRRKGPPKGDNSNSQYAALGIRACMQSGLVFPRSVLMKALGWWEKSQRMDGGWGYDHKRSGAEPSYGSMTAGAVGASVIYRHYLKARIKKDKRILAGFRWMDGNFTVKENPQFRMPRMWHYYWLYAIERAGMLYRTEFIGKHEWYVKGATFLLEEQKSGGSWDSMGVGGFGLGGAIGAVATTDTCFAILFLRRATKPLPGVRTGEPSKKKK